MAATAAPPAGRQCSDLCPWAACQAAGEGRRRTAQWWSPGPPSLPVLRCRSAVGRPESPDRRVKRVYLTDKGRIAVAAVGRELRELLGPRRYSQLRATLEAITEPVAKNDPPGSGRHRTARRGSRLRFLPVAPERGNPEQIYHPMHNPLPIEFHARSTGTWCGSGRTKRRFPITNYLQRISRSRCVGASPTGHL